MPRLPLPILGVANVSATLDTPDEFAPPGAMLNVVSNGQGNRRRLSVRAGLVKVFPQRVGRNGNHRPQAIEVISRASAVTSFVLGTASPITGRPQRSEPVTLNAAVLATGVVSLVEGVYIRPGTGTIEGLRQSQSLTAPVVLENLGNFPDPATCAWCGMHVSGTLGVYAFNWLDDVWQRTLLVFVDPRDGAFLGSRVVSSIAADESTGTGTKGPNGDGGLLEFGGFVDSGKFSPSDPANVAPSAYCITRSHVLVARGRQLAGVDLIEFGGRWFPNKIVSIGQGDMPQAVGVIVAMGSNGTDAVWCGFLGSREAGTTINPSGNIDPGQPAAHFRSGVTRLALVREAGAWAIDRVPIGGDPDITLPYAESDTLGAVVDHQTTRLSEQLERGPRGAFISSIAVDGDGQFVIGMSNSGWGPTTTQTPGDHPPTTVARFDAAGLLLWESDTGSLIPSEQGGGRSGSGTRYVTDCPDEGGGTTKNGPAIKAVAIDASGSVYAAGRIAASGHSVYRLGGAGGQIQWRRNVHEGATVGGSNGTPFYGLAVDPGDNQAVVVTARNKLHQPGTTGEPFASVLKLGLTDGASVWTHSITQDLSEPSLTCVAAAAERLLIGGPRFVDGGTS